MPDILHFIDGQADHGEGNRFGDVFDPNTGIIQARVALGTAADGGPEAVVQTAQAPFTTETVPGARLAWWADG